MGAFEIASVAKYYHISPLDVENWKTVQVNEWLEEAIRIEKEKAEAMKKEDQRNSS